MNIKDVMARCGYCTFSDEAWLVDAINSSLSNAAFLMMIIGDGIRSSVQQLAEFLNENTSMAFNLALSELEIYRSSGDTIVIPNLITKTTVIERRLSRREFISAFSDNGGYDPDEITGFIYDLEAIDGLAIGIAPTELTLRFSPEDGVSYAFLTFGISSGHSDIWVMPGRIKSALEKHGRFPFCADEFLEFFKPFVNVKRCKCPPYKNEAAFYYGNVTDILLHKKEFIAAVEDFVNGVENQRE